MPSLTICGRNYHTCLDTLPVFFAPGAVTCAVYICVFIPFLHAYGVWTSCSATSGVQYFVASAGLIACFSASLVNETALTVLGFRGRSCTLGNGSGRPVGAVLCIVLLLQFSDCDTNEHGNVLVARLRCVDEKSRSCLMHVDHI